MSGRVVQVLVATAAVLLIGGTLAFLTLGTRQESTFSDVRSEILPASKDSESANSDAAKTMQDGNVAASATTSSADSAERPSSENVGDSSSPSPTDRASGDPANKPAAGP